MISDARSTVSQRQSVATAGLLALEPLRYSGTSVCVLTIGRHLIGTDDHCQVQLKADGVQPQHAILLVGEQKVLLKSLDPRTWVNDNSVTETALRVGDRISVGPITFKVRRANDQELAQTITRAPAPVQPIPAPAQDLWQPAYDPIELPQEIEAPPLPAEPPAHESPLANITIFKSDVAATVLAKPVHSPAEVVSDLHAVQQQIESLGSQGISHKVASEPDVLSLDHELGGERDVELNQLAKDLATRSQKLSQREQRLAAREEELERKEELLAEEHNRLLKTAQTTQQELASECARQQRLWEEWDKTYQRSLADLKAQFAAVETQREEIRGEHLRLDQKRDEIRQLQLQTEDLQCEVAAEKVRITEELTRLQAQIAALENERRQHLAERDDHRNRIENDYRTLNAAQEDVRLARQQIEAGRASLSSERELESNRLRREKSELSEQRTRLIEQEAVIKREKNEIESQARNLQSQQQQLGREIAELETKKAEFAAQCASKAIVDSGISASPDHERDPQGGESSPRDDNEHLFLELQRWQDELKAQQAQLELDQNNARLERQAIVDARAALEKAFEVRGDSQNPLTANAASPALSEGGDWLPLSDTVERLMGIYGVSQPSTTTEPADHGSSAADRCDRRQIVVEDSPASSIHDTPLIDRRLNEGPCQPQQSFVEAYQTVQRHEHDLRSAHVLTQPHISSLPLRDAAPVGTPDDELDEVDDSVSFVGETGLSASLLATANPGTAVDTLNDVNYRFGFIDERLDQTQAIAPDLTQPLSARGATDDSANHLQTDSDVPGSTTEGSADPLQSLRAQLAQMFDLQNVAEAAGDDSHDSAGNADPASDVRGNDEGLMAGQQAAIETEVSAAPPADSITAPEAHVGTGEVSLNRDAEGKNADGDNANVAVEEVSSSGDEDPWERRLRELSAVAQSIQPPAQPAANSKSAEESEAEDEEFSVEAQLARLLGRPVNSAKPADEPAPEVVEQSLESLSSAELSLPTEFPSPDRTHLVSEPRHKQDKDALREKVQSFREVAQMSARNALEKHSWNNFKSEFYFSFALLIVSFTATAWYTASYFYSQEDNPWKAIACVVATSISGLKVLTLLSRLKGKRTAKSA